MSWLMRALTAVLGVLLVVAGVAATLVHSDGHKVSSTAIRSTTTVTTVLPAPPPSTVSTTVAPTTSSSRSTTTTAPVPPTPPLSPIAALNAGLNASLAGTNSCLEVENGQGQVVYQSRSDNPLIPASTQKLLVAEAALAVLGPNYRFTTKVVAPAVPVHGQVSALWLVGGGDPLLATPQFIAMEAGHVREAGYQWTPLASLASQLMAAGVTQVPGGIRGDDTAESQLRFLPVWPASYQQQEQIGLLSALSVDEGIQYTPPHTTLAPDPPAYAAAQLAQLLSGPNVAVTGGPDEAAPAKSVVLATVSSAPLSQIVESLIRASDDWIAELLTRAIDKASGGSGTTAGGVSVVMSRAQQAGIPLAGAHMDDGSGLSRTDRATCNELLSALNAAAQPANAPVMAGLPVAAETGTLVGRFRGTPIAGKLQAKTGSLDGVAGLVGVVNGPATMRFAFVENDPVSETVLDARQNAVVDAIATYAGIAGAVAHS